LLDSRHPERSFDWYAASLAAGITGPFVIWGMYVLLEPRYVLIAVASALFIGFAFLGFGRLKIR